MNARVEADPGLMGQRRCAAEHPFGAVKRMTAGGRFLTRGLAKVKTEAALSILAYNMLRAINLIGAASLCQTRLTKVKEAPDRRSLSFPHSLLRAAFGFLCWRSDHWPAV